MSWIPALLSPAPQKPVDRVAEQQLLDADAADGLCWEVRGTPGRLIQLVRQGLAAQVWWNRVSGRYEWDLVDATGGRGWLNGSMPCGHEPSAAAAIDRAAGELAAAVAGTARVRARGVR